MDEKFKAKMETVTYLTVLQTYAISRKPELNEQNVPMAFLLKNMTRSLLIPAPGLAWPMRMRNVKAKDNTAFVKDASVYIRDTFYQAKEAQKCPTSPFNESGCLTGQLQGPKRVAQTTLT